LPSEAKAAAKLLLRLKLIRQQIDGGYIQTSSAIVADNAVTSMALRTFNKIMMDHAKIAVDYIDRRLRHISGVTIGISPETYEVLSAEIEAFKDRVKLIVNHDKESSVVYQMNISLFPISRTIHEIDGKKGAS
jgi:uncharacterized protein (TIGR02147 family)